MRYCSECKKEKDSNYCSFCNIETANRYVLKAETGFFKLRLNLTKFFHRRPGVKRPLSEVHVGATHSRDSSKHPEGVHISRRIDRENDKYEEIVTDIKTGEVTRSIQEPLSQHISPLQKKTDPEKS